MKSKLIFVFLFIILGFVALQLPVNKLAGSRVSFTLFDLFAPISAVFLGSVYGIIAVFFMQGANLIFNGLGNVDKGSIIRLFPTLFAVLYFALAAKSKSKNYILFVPLISILVFNLHPIGKTVWYYSLFWFIPLLAWPLRRRFLFARALGATFTAHSVGGAVWIWVFNLPAAVWISLIPIVAMERGIFALGVSASYILMNNILSFLSYKQFLPKSVTFDRRYVLRTLNSKL
ncbi:hypothetical protein A3J17_03300 [Candidatus Curtissbacteria bacterium RIFCSPLOWO2_02_FULL_40_11]|uniref:Uncharacterized protein n=2 Tax=Candidatus Curtissiibacteriota TaxID=1752717 RepID=A0A1F5G6Q0_9BACT|nr:MAG: hypothetical protein A3D04_04715 [Candidatus Curtissbacteria bacterium RIFCSPHIGHO2_02_FULL_40_16b]OGE00923.1 MAG: hypothetical protein A3J17_03300 [Candidatus Curtissbacteria bacterium RIFCSPLOWO2_02_FULL_40_11]OGE12095.1 MAG: hypothetical protein A3G14_00795 [Candidatus Curtissbacteria bacterium RIFCSPLOWO2_12_FULL_38_9]